MALRRCIALRCKEAAAAATSAAPTPVAASAGTQGETEKIIQTIPFVGAPLTALSDSATYKELSEIREAHPHDPAAAVSQKFFEAQKKLIAWRLHRLRTEWQEFQDQPAPSSLSGVLIFIRTVVLSAVAYAVGFYLNSMYHGVELPVVGMIMGKEFERPKPLP